MVFVLVLFLGGFALHCTVKEVPRETPQIVQIIEQAPIPERLPDSQGER